MKLVEVIDQFSIDCEVRGLSDETVSWYRRRLGLFARKLDQEFNVTELEDVKIMHLRQFVHLMMKTKSGENNPRAPTQEKPLSTFTVRGYVRVIKVFFQLVRRRGGPGYEPVEQAGTAESARLPHSDIYA